MYVLVECILHGDAVSYEVMEEVFVSGTPRGDEGI